MNDRKKIIDDLRTSIIKLCLCFGSEDPEQQQTVLSIGNAMQAAKEYLEKEEKEGR